MADIVSCLCGHSSPPSRPDRPLLPGSTTSAKCEACETWQHVVCMGVRDMFEGRAQEPDHYFCHECARLGWEADGYDYTKPRSRSPTSQAHAETWEAIARGEKEGEIAGRRVEAWRREEKGRGGPRPDVAETLRPFKIAAAKPVERKSGGFKLKLKNTRGGSAAKKVDRRAGGVRYAPGGESGAAMPVRESGALAGRAVRVPVKVPGTGEDDSPERSTEGE
ncbi:hypothetical protein TI39_contig47g00005 [Zymoseptoria brevis]|uniref:Zinc finger PHD-type domain-containing protein n=1 Tax=Zymoseptoria brevis TaxID=1047168 RepID=A0A0F4GZR2_9PEZI|nr:hypothetical protein TI39_contig47g00005 [Zymoseptoria brevis]